VEEFSCEGDGYYPRFSHEEFQRRYKKIREVMANQGLDCVIFAGTPSLTSGGGFGVTYVSNYTVWTTCGYVVFPLEGDPTLILPINRNCHLPNVRAVSVINDIRSSIRGGEGMAVVERIRELGLEKSAIGITALDWQGRTVLLNFHRYLEQNLSEVRLRLLDYDFLARIWLVKSPEEIEFFEKAARICDLAVERAIDMIEPGVKEHEVAAVMKHEILRNQAEIAFVMVGSTPMANPALSFPNMVPPARPLQEGDIFLNELGVRLSGLEAQTGKPISLGEPTTRYKEFYENIVLELFRLIVEAIKPGNTVKDIQKAGSVMVKAGYQPAAPLVHGVTVGQDMPFVWPSFAIPPDLTFESNMVLVPEVNPQTPNGRFGVFLGDTYVITEDGARSLNKYPLEMTVT